jgi:hypothetical protein
MNEDRDNRLPASPIWFLIYQWILVLLSLCYAGISVVELFDPQGGVSIAEFTVGILVILVLASWGTAIAFASVGMRRKSPRGLLARMICHLIVAILSMVGFITFCSLGVLSLFSASHEARGFAPMFLLFALMWLPTMLVSGWGFFCLRRLRMSLSP